MEKENYVQMLPLPHDLETKAVLRQLSRSHRNLAELKGVASTMPNERILLSTLVLQEAKDSSDIENIVTTHDELYKAGLGLNCLVDASAKEVWAYREAVERGFAIVREKGLLANRVIIDVQSTLVGNSAGFRKMPGTKLKRTDGKVVYMPPQDGAVVLDLMQNLEQFINDEAMSPLDPLVKMAIIHHQFESIHPFYDGNGRTGRIVNVLYLVKSGLLDLPILYLSRFITRHKAEYYHLLQSVREKQPDNAEEWEAWVLFMLKGVEVTSAETIRLVKGISSLMDEYKSALRPLFQKQYRRELLNNLFFHPYTKIEFVMRDLMLQRRAATRYLNVIVDAGLLSKEKIGRTNYYINWRLVSLFANCNSNNDDIPPIETIIDAH